MSFTVILEDEFGHIYTFRETKFNLDFPIQKIGIPGKSITTFSNDLVGSSALTDTIENNDSNILILTYA
jgi:hypothetical protein